MLSQKQKLSLVLVARRAFEKSRSPEGSHLTQPSPPAEREFTEWRHREVARACGKAGLRCCENNDYGRVMAHFLHLLGEDGKAMEWHLRAESDPRRQAEAVLWREMNAAGLRAGYVEAICRNQFRCSVTEAGTKQLWSLVYTVRNRARAKRKDLTAKNAKNAKSAKKEVVPF